MKLLGQILISSVFTLILAFTSKARIKYFGFILLAGTITLGGLRAYSSDIPFNLGAFCFTYVLLPIFLLWAMCFMWMTDIAATDRFQKIAKREEEKENDQ